MKKAEMVKAWDDGQLWVDSGSGKAVKVVWGYATEGPGTYNYAGSWAIAEAGNIEDGEFQPEVWTEDDFGKGIFTRRVIGNAKQYETYNPEVSEDGEVDWDAVDAWMEGAVERLMGSAG